MHSPLRTLTFAALLLGSAAALAQAAPAPLDVQATGRELTRQFYAGEIDKIWARMSPQMKKALGDDPDGLRAVQLQIKSQLGAEREVVSEHVYPAAEYLVYQRLVLYTKLDLPFNAQWTLDSKGGVGGFFVLKATPAESKFLDYKMKNTYALPFRGEWLVLFGGRTVEQNKHAVATDQRFAYDLVAVKEGKSYSGEGKALTDYFGFGQPILAPAAGTVTEATDGQPDNALGGAADGQHPAGNHVILDLGQGEFAVFAHFQQGSVRVKPGDKVKAGDVLGACGNSGNSPTPHLHFHVQNSAKLFDSEGLPVQFSHYEANGKPVALGEPVRGETLRPAPPAAQ